MEKTEMMNQIEHEAELNATIQTGTCGELPMWWYVLELERRLEKVQAKATAYDRIMSGGKKSMKEFANLLGRAVVVNSMGDIQSFAGVPKIDLHYGFWYLDEDDEDYDDFGYFIPPDIVDYTGNWRDSLTLPDGWEEACSKI